MSRITSLSHFESHTFSGIWWLPDYPNEKTFGKLSYEIDKQVDLILELSPEYDSPIDKLLSSLNGEIPLLHGLVDHNIFTVADLKGPPIPAKHSKQNAKGTSYDVTQVFHYNAKYLTIGQYSSSPNAFKKISVSSSGIDKYFGNFADIKHNARKLVYPLIYKKVKFLDGHIAIGTTFSTRGRTTHIKEQATLNITNKNKQDFGWFWKRIFRLQLLVNLLTGRVSPAQEIFGSEKLALTSPKNPMLLSGQFDIEKNIASQKEYRKKSTWDVVPYVFIKAHFPAICNYWLSISDDIFRFYHIFHAALLDDYKFFDYRFITLSQALEIFHILKYASYKPPGATKNHQISLTERMAHFQSIYHSKYPNLNYYLTHQWWMQPKKSFTIEEIATKIGSYRNFYTHPLNKKGEPKTSPDDSQFFLINHMHALLYVGILDELCMPADVIGKAIANLINIRG